MRHRPLVLQAIVVMLILPVLVGAQQSAGAQPASAPQSTAQLPQQKTEQPSTQVTDPNDPYFGVPPLPPGSVSLLGGTVHKIDRIRSHFTVQPFGDSKRVNVKFDERTHIYRDGVETTERSIQKGDRVYVDTLVDGPNILAKNVRVVTHVRGGEARGQITEYDAHDGIVTMRDELSEQAVSFRVTQDTKVKGAQSSTAQDLVPGALVAVRYAPGGGAHGVAREVSVLAVPGTSFTFVGKVLHLDMRMGTLVVDNQTDNKSYELQFQPGVVGEKVMVGSHVTVSAMFDGTGYHARTVSVQE